MCEIAKICEKWLKYLTSFFINWDMTQRFGKWLKKNCEMAQIYGARIKYLIYGISMLQMT